MRLPYRVYEVDGAGTTHFDRFLDVFFYDRELSIRISFDHLLDDPEHFYEMLLGRFDADAALPQVVVLATDGEVYGHHEPAAHEVLARFFAEIAPARGIHVSNFEQYLAENPPAAEARLWFGPDERGSSWSCSHGVGRWWRDCGCQAGGPREWTQAWRTPLRQALDDLAGQVNAAFVREAGRLLHDPWEARDDYIRVLLQPEAAAQDAFLQAHACADLSSEDRTRAWELLEASRNAMLMYTSCGWYFADIAGIEAVQNLSYAVRAAELIRPYTDADPVERLQQHLQGGPSNQPGKGTGADILHQDVLPARYGPEAIAATHVLARLLDLAEPSYAVGVAVEEDPRATTGPHRTSQGWLRLTDPRTGRAWDCAFCAAASTPEATGVLFDHATPDAFLRQARDWSDHALARAVRQAGIRLESLPRADRERFLHVLVSEQEAALCEDAHAVYDRARPLLETLATNRVAPPPLLGLCAVRVLEDRLSAIVASAAEARQASDRLLDQAQQVMAEAASADLRIDRTNACRTLTRAIAGQVAAYQQGPVRPAMEQTSSLLALAQTTDLHVLDDGAVQQAFWEFVRSRTPALTAEPHDATLCAALLDLGEALGFARPALAACLPA